MARLGVVLGAMFVLVFVFGAKACVKNFDIVIRNVGNIFSPNIKPFDPAISFGSTGVPDSKVDTSRKVSFEPDLMSEAIESKAFRDLSLTGYKQCARQEWKQDAREKIGNYQWVEKALTSGDPEKHIIDGIYNEINNRLQVQLGEFVPVSVSIDIKESVIVVSVDTPCGFDRFSAIRVEVPPKIQNRQHCLA